MGLVHLVQDVTETGTLEQELTQQRNELQLLQRELRQSNLELAAANAELKRLDDLKSQFVSVAAHELRNPLTSILGYVEMLLDDDFGPLLGRTARVPGRRLWGRAPPAGDHQRPAGRDAHRGRADRPGLASRSIWRAW